MTTPLVLQPDWNAPTTPLRHTWEGVVNIDQFRWLVRKDCLEHVAMAKRELGATHVRAVGMFCDELRTWGMDPTYFGKPGPHPPRLNWQVVDYIIDELAELGLMPQYTTSFMPSHMASGELTCFSTRSRTSPPKDWDQWESFVFEAVKHQVQHRSAEVVKNWWFEVWNEPNLSPPFWGGDQKDFFTLWQRTYRAIKRANPALRVGGPSAARAEWVGDLLDFGRKNGCEPDYIITHCYNNDSAGKPLSPFEGPQGDKENLSPHFFAGVARGVRKVLDQAGYRGDVMWNEWGRSWHPYAPARETASEAAWVVKSMAEVSQLADSFGFWCLSDIYDQVGYGSEAFHGNYGMLSLQGLRKPVYHAFQLLSRLGTKRAPVTGTGLSLNHGAIATSNGAGRSVLVYAYTDNEERGSLDVRIPGVPAGARLTRVSDVENNILADWRSLGAPANLTRDQQRHLHARNLLSSTAVPVIDGVATFRLETPGIALIEW